MTISLATKPKISAMVSCSLMPMRGEHRVQQAADHAGQGVGAGRGGGRRQMGEQPYQHHAGDDELGGAAEEMFHFQPAAQQHLARGGEAVGRQFQHERFVVREVAS